MGAALARRGTIRPQTRGASVDERDWTPTVVSASLAWIRERQPAAWRALERASLGQARRLQRIGYLQIVLAAVVQLLVLAAFATRMPGSSGSLAWWLGGCVAGAASGAGVSFLGLGASVRLLAWLKGEREAGDR